MISGVHVSSILNESVTFENTSHRMPPSSWYMLFLTSRLDNGNSLPYGLPTSTIGHLKKIRKSAARLITRTRKFDSITPALRNLHWLPLEKRIIFKINVLTFRAMHGTDPQYLADLLHIHTPSRILRSSSKTLLSVVQPRLDSYGSHHITSLANKH